MQTLMTAPIEVPDSIFKNLVLNLLIEIKSDQMIMKSHIERLVKGDPSMSSTELEWFSRMSKDLVVTSFANVLMTYFGRIPEGILPDGVVGSASDPERS